MFVVGIDGGATNTRAVLVAETGKLLGYGNAGPSNYDNVGIDAARTNIVAAIHQAFADASVPFTPAASVFLGMAGVVSERDRSIIRQIAVGANIALEENVGIDHDIRIALAGGLTGSEGIVLIAGTGSSCYGRRRDGRNHRTGWGYLLDDMGSGYYLGMQAMIATVREADGRGRESRLSGSIRERLGFSNVDDIMRILYHEGLSITAIAALAPMVLETAEMGDVVALGIVERGTSELAMMVKTVADTLKFETRPIHITFAGGLTRSDFYRRHIELAIKQQVPGAVLQKPEMPPILGAALLAMELAGAPASDEAITALKAESVRLKLEIT
jgi:N-acetylglucosamine kinase-like BadF-type ATPase